MGHDGWRAPHVIADEVAPFVHPGRLTAAGGWCVPAEFPYVLGLDYIIKEPPMNEPRTYVKKPVAIEAIQWDGTAAGATPIINWILTGADTAIYVGPGESHSLRREEEMEPGYDAIVKHDAPGFIVIHTLEGAMRADALDWIIKGVQGEFYPCKPDIFAQSYLKRP